MDLSNIMKSTKPTIIKAASLLHHRAMADKNNARLQPPPGMAEPQKAVWNQLVENLPSDWFAAEQTPQLVAYAGHCVRLEKIETSLATLDPIQDITVYDKLVKLAAGESAKIAMHSRSFRLTVQSRLKAETAFGRAGGAASAAAASKRPWDVDGLLA
ncbi:MAG: hypothetical protein Q7U05_06965 [Polaromonas sp.]|nr:hypothetical protein [Polaromonas sp.]